MPVFVLPVVGVVGHGGQKLQEAVEGVTVARWEQVDQKLSDILLLIWVQHCNTGQDGDGENDTTKGRETEGR